MDPDKTLKTTREGKHAAAARDGRHAKATAETHATIAPVFTLGEGHVEPRTTQVVMVAGIRLGELHTSDGTRTGARCHACLDLSHVADIPMGGATPLAQGHGNTAGEAIAAAIATGRRYVVDYAAALEKAAGMLGIK